MRDRRAYYASYRATHGAIPKDKYPPDEGCAYSPLCRTCRRDHCRLDNTRPYFQDLKPPLKQPPIPVWTKKPLPTTCPHCSSEKIGTDTYRDEIFCGSCWSSTLLPWLPAGRIVPHFVSPNLNKFY